LTAELSCSPEESVLNQHIADADAPEYALVVENADRPSVIEQMIEDIFTRQPVEVDTTALSGDEQSRLVLLINDRIAASSPLQEIESSLLLVNSDRYITGAAQLEEIEYPDVITALTETPFHLHGYPESNNEKLILVLISRYIERLSYEYGGVHRASFQRLSRLLDENGTENVYRRLGDADVDTHVYGVPDQIPPRGYGVKIHGGYTCDYRNSWFVVHQSETAAAALMAIEIAPNKWKAEWTFNPNKVTAINDIIRTKL
jgi:hypothetical protein